MPDLSSFESIDPCTGHAWASHQITSDEELELLEAEAKSYLKQPLERTQRLEILANLRALLEQHAVSIAQLISQETGKPLWESQTEAALLATKIDVTIESSKQRQAPVWESGLDRTHYTTFFPHGIVAILGPYNFPCHLPHGHIIPSFLAGNAVLFKPSEYTTRCGQHLVALYRQAGMPSGAVQLVQGDGRIGHKLLQRPSLRAVFFTGSSHTGKKILSEFATKPHVMIALEMGGNNPLVVTKIDKDPSWVDTVLTSSFLTTGQRCTSCRRLILENHDEFLADVITQAKKLSIGSPAQNCFMGPLISEQAKHTVLKAQENMVKLGGEVLLQAKDLGHGFISPGIVDMTRATQLYDHEVFGPLVQVFRVHSFQEALERANQTEYGLCASLLSTDLTQQNLFRHHVEAGIVNSNAPTNGALSILPFGGIKASGNFRPAGYYTTDFCSYPKAGVIYPKPPPPPPYLKECR